MSNRGYLYCTFCYSPLNVQSKTYRYQAIKQKEQSKLKRQDYQVKQGDTNDRTT